MRSSTITAAAVAALASVALAQNNSVNMWIDDALNGQGLYAASVVGACKDQTTYALRCTSARDSDIGSRTCGPAAPVRYTYRVKTRRRSHEN
jgi:hypothetical protein